MYNQSLRNKFDDIQFENQNTSSHNTVVVETWLYTNGGFFYNLEGYLTVQRCNKSRRDGDNVRKK